MSDDSGYAKVSLEDVEPRDLDDVEPALLSVGYELRPSEMRPNVWRFDQGQATNEHRHGDQEELYVVLDGAFEVRVWDGDGANSNGDGEDGNENDEETFVLETGDFMVVQPDSWRRLTATEGSLLLVVGAPPVKDDDERRERE